MSTYLSDCTAACVAELNNRPVYLEFCTPKSIKQACYQACFQTQYMNNPDTDRTASLVIKEAFNRRDLRRIKTMASAILTKSLRNQCEPMAPGEVRRITRPLPMVLPAAVPAGQNAPPPANPKDQMCTADFTSSDLPTPWIVPVLAIGARVLWGIGTAIFGS